MSVICYTFSFVMITLWWKQMGKF